MKTAKLMGGSLCCALLLVACSKSAPSATGGSLPAQSESTSAQPVMDSSLKLFGVQLKGADRTAFRKALLNDGRKLLQAGSWVDQYSPEGTLEGATAFEIGYVAGEDRFAYAEYKFASFVDAGQISRIARLIEAKYGPPDTTAGNPKVGEASFQWDFPDRTFVRVSRGWPDTSTYLSFADEESLAKLRQQQEASNTRLEQKKVQAQSDYF